MLPDKMHQCAMIVNQEKNCETLKVAWELDRKAFLAGNAFSAKNAFSAANAFSARNYNLARYSF